MSEPNELLPGSQPQPHKLESDIPSEGEPGADGVEADAPVIFAQLESEVYCTAISPDGRRVIAGLKDGTLHLFDLIDGTRVGQPFQGHTAYVWSVAFSPDGQTIVSGSDDNTIRLWNREGAQIGQPFQGHTASVWSVAFSPDGQTIVSGSADTSVSLWQLGADFRAQRLWVVPAVIARPIRNLAERRRQISVPQSIANDAAQGEDQLKVKDEIEALATVLMLRSLQPPVAVGILGSWGSGKSFGMHLIRQKVNKIRRQRLNSGEAWGYPGESDRPDLLSPYVGHIYQIEFNAWTYAKSDLWASLMQEIFYELNRQISLERQLGYILSGSLPSSSKIATSEATKSDASGTIPTNERSIDRFIYVPFVRIRSTILELVKQVCAKLTRFIQQLLNLWFVQLVWHIVILVLIISLLLLYLLVWFCDRLTGERFEIHSKTFDFLQPFFDGLNLEEQLENYYFRDNSEKTFKENWFGKVEFIFEHVLFLLFEGFPQRLHDRQNYWKNWQNAQTKPAPSTPEPSKPADSEINIDSVAYAQALREGGKFWQVLYLMSEEERTTFLHKNLNEKFQNWKELTSNSAISNSLWNALDQIKQEEQKLFKQQEEKLQEKEKELQRTLKTAEAEVNQKLARRSATAFWMPVLNAIAHLRFSKEEIEHFAVTGKTAHMVRKTITSWQGLLALFFMALVTVIALDATARSILIIAIADLIQQDWVVKQFNQLVPVSVQSFFLSLNHALVTWLSNLPQWLQKLQATIPVGLQLFAAITAAVTALIPVLKTVMTYIESVQKEQDRIQSERDILLKQEQSKAENLIQQVAQLKLQVEEQRQRLGLTANYRTLMDFVSDRLKEDDYGKRLGLMQQVKQDLAALSDRLTDQTHNRKELQKCFPRGPARVILYIDDLDRCPPKRVVEVLEAVQLLLNTKLFIVVLGIDDRYIARALEQVYQGVLKRGGKPSGIDYLEKIIQIPYRMRPISPATVGSYLKSQLKLRSSAATSEIQPSESSIFKSNPIAQEHGLDPANNGHSNSSQRNESIASPPSSDSSDSSDPSDPLDPSVSSPQPANDSTVNVPVEALEAEPSEATSAQNVPVIQTAQTPTWQPPTPSTSPQLSTPTNAATYLETVAAITEFDATELDLLVDCCKYVDITPRTAKRLINIYKILQIIWSTRSQQLPPQSPPTEQEKLVVMSFLALSGRYPDYMRNLFEEIDVKLEEQMFNTLEEQMFNTLDGHPADNPQLDIKLDILLKHSKLPIPESNRHAHREWRKFTSDIQQMLKSSKTVTIDRKTFDLMLSFCFVGDIGYDPDDYQPNGRFTTQSKPSPIDSDKLADELSTATEHE